MEPLGIYVTGVLKAYMPFAKHTQCFTEHISEVVTL
jgi:hypothetical protein